MELELESGGEDKIGRKDTGEGRGGKSVGGGGEIGIERMESSGGLEEGGDGGAGAVRTDGVGGEKGKESGFRATMRNILSLVKGKILVRDVDVGGMSVRDVGDQVDYGEEAVEMEEFLLVNMRGLLGTRGWEEREEAAKEDRRWLRTIIEKGEKREEGMPLPKEYRLGLEGRGEELNSSARNKNGMGTGRKAIFPKENGEKGEGKNWIATFTKSGCIGCRNDREELVHQGRNSEPVVLIKGDEAVPMSVGITKEGKGEQGCTWIFKKEHLQLGEVAGILRRIHLDKQEHDREQGKRPHEFFIPNGSKILVGSYTHLRKEGLEGYASDFSNMVKDVWAVTGDIGVEVLPVTPVVFEGIDSEGGRLISGLKEWIRWIGEESGREAVKWLAETGGQEEGGEPGRYLFKPQMALLQSKNKERKEWAMRGNMIGMVRADRREEVVQEARPSKELVLLVEMEGI